MSLPTFGLARTASQIVDAADRPRERTSSRAVSSLGDSAGSQTFVDQAQLATLLRRLQPAQPEISHRNGLWELTMPLPQVADLPAALLHASSPDLVATADDAVAQLRLWAAQDPHGVTGHPLVWMVHASTDTALVGWLGLAL